MAESQKPQEQWTVTIKRSKDAGPLLDGLLKGSGDAALAAKYLKHHPDGTLLRTAEGAQPLSAEQLEAIRRDLLSSGIDIGTAGHQT